MNVGALATKSLLCHEERLKGVVVKPQGDFWVWGLCLAGLCHPATCHSVILQTLCIPSLSQACITCRNTPVDKTQNFLMKLTASKESRGWALVSHACNPSYSGDRDQEDHDSKPAQTNSS
jgi:hypothetical protein